LSGIFREKKRIPETGDRIQKPRPRVPFDDAQDKEARGLNAHRGDSSRKEARGEETGKVWSTRNRPRDRTRIDRQRDRGLPLSGARAGPTGTESSHGAARAGPLLDGTCDALF